MNDIARLLKLVLSEREHKSSVNCVNTRIIEYIISLSLSHNNGWLGLPQPAWALSF